MNMNEYKCIVSIFACIDLLLLHDMLQSYVQIESDSSSLLVLRLGFACFGTGSTDVGGANQLHQSAAGHRWWRHAVDIFLASWPAVGDIAFDGYHGGSLVAIQGSPRSIEPFECVFIPIFWTWRPRNPQRRPRDLDSSVAKVGTWPCPDIFSRTECEFGNL